MTALASSMLPTRLLGPQRIICLTVWATEWLYLLGEEQRIVGISGFSTRPRRAREEKPKVGTFTRARIEAILALQPDLVLAYSGRQADTAAQLAHAGIAVMVFNQFSVAEIFEALAQVAALVGASDPGHALLIGYRERLLDMQQLAQSRIAQGKRRPRVYFEECNQPLLSGSPWVSELIGIVGGIDCLAGRTARSGARRLCEVDPQEVIACAPDLIIGSWCGKPFERDQVVGRPGWHELPAVRTGQVHTLPSSEILQAGPAALTAGAEALHRIVMDWMDAHG